MKKICRKFLVKGFAVSLLSAVAVLGFTSNANAGCNHDQGRQYCTNDAMKLCSAFIPNEAKIEACLRNNFKKLSPNCKKCFSSFGEAMGWAQ